MKQTFQKKVQLEGGKEINEEILERKVCLVSVRNEERKQTRLRNQKIKEEIIKKKMEKAFIDGKKTRL